jgi:hypothetical protein
MEVRSDINIAIGFWLMASSRRNIFLRLVAGGWLLGAGRWKLGADPPAHTLTLPELQRIPLLEPLVMTTVRTEPGKGKIHPAVKSEFLGDDFEGGGTRRVVS